jgi:hypothetical protein
MVGGCVLCVVAQRDVDGVCSGRGGIGTAKDAMCCVDQWRVCWPEGYKVGRPLGKDSGMGATRSWCVGDTGMNKWPDEWVGVAATCGLVPSPTGVGGGRPVTMAVCGAHDMPAAIRSRRPKHEFWPRIEVG